MNKEKKTLRDLTIGELKAYFNTTWLYIKGEYIYSEGNAYLLDMELIKNEEQENEATK